MFLAVRFVSTLLMLSTFAAAAIVEPERWKHKDQHTLPLPTRNVFQFRTNGTWIENIAVRPNGDLLLTMLSPTASLYTLKEPRSTSPGLSLVHTFDNATSLLGITEIHHETFALLSVKAKNDSTAVPGSVTLWVVSPTADGTWDTEKVAILPDVVVPNGITSIPGSSAVLVVDSIGGTITRCDLRAGACAVVLSGPEVAPISGDSSRPVGINGIHYHDGYIYWTHSGLVSVFRRRIDRQGYPIANANSELIGTLDAQFVDDFAVDAAGQFWVATNVYGSLFALDRDGTSKVVAGSPTELTLGGCTSAAFGRTLLDRKTLYVATNGVNGIKEPAKVVAVDAAEYCIK
ncbi:hypothetical protein GGS20DRAFT_577283 [Poronia punctata]|nr:hypothetical protein GGS20DRAFT_577283 [Poronia punctata]